MGIQPYIGFAICQGLLKQALKLFWQRDRSIKRKLRSDNCVGTLKSNAVTCTVCGEVLGTYIIDDNGDRFRLPVEQTYAFLKFNPIQRGSIHLSPSKEGLTNSNRYLKVSLL
jgi:hypothetical protein